MDAVNIAESLLKLQHTRHLSAENLQQLAEFIRAPMLILPAASRGHAMGFVRYQNWWAKIDRGENSAKEGTVNLYRITRPEAFTVEFLQAFLYQKQSRLFFHKHINKQLGLEPVATLPLTKQTAGNCSWANIQGVVPVAYALQQLATKDAFDSTEVMDLYDYWVAWDQDRALDECIQQFYQADALRKASIASILAGILFHACDYSVSHHIERAEKILKILTLPAFYYILETYLEIYCVKRLSRKGNNLLKILDDCGINPNIGVTPIATGLNDL